MKVEAVIWLELNTQNKKKVCRRKVEGNGI